MSPDDLYHSPIGAAKPPPIPASFAQTTDIGTQATTSRANEAVVLGSHEEIVPPSLRLASTIAYTAMSAIGVILVAVALVVAIIWFISDLTSIHPAGMSSSAVRNQVIDATANFLANLALVVVLVEVVMTFVLVIQTRRASPRPLLLIPLFVVMRGIILLTNQLITAGIGATTETFFKLLAQMGAFAIVGLLISMALATMRDPLPINAANHRATATHS